MSISTDIDKGTTVGEPDGPMRFIESFGFEVPTFIDPRDDLKHPKARIKCLDHHVPFNLRGGYRPDQLPREYYEKRKGRIQVNMEGWVLCSANTVKGFPCDKVAENRSLFCTVHGGALHPLDKKLTPETYVPVGNEPDMQERIAKLDRVQRFMQGYLTVEELDDDEITGAYVRNSDGVPIANTKLGVRFQQEMVKELARRMNHFMQMKLPNMLKVVTDIAESDIVEPADRIKAAIWAAERVIGKTPEVVIHGKTEKAYESVFETLQTGSREDYRNSTHVDSQRAIEADAASEIIDVEEVDGNFFDRIEYDTDNVQDSEIQSSNEFVGGSTTSEFRSEDEELDSSIDYSQVPLNKVEKYATLEEKRAALKNSRDRLKKAKSRRFAARASGAATVGDTPWYLDWIKRADGTWRCVMIRPENMTPAKLEKLESRKLEYARLEKESENG